MHGAGDGCDGVMQGGGEIHGGGDEGVGGVGFGFSADRTFRPDRRSNSAGAGTGPSDVNSAVWARSQ